MSFAYPNHGQESVQQVNSQDKSLCAVTKEAGQTPQVLHFGISALGRDPTVILENKDVLLINLVYLPHPDDYLQFGRIVLKRPACHSIKAAQTWDMAGMCHFI